MDGPSLTSRLRPWAPHTVACVPQPAGAVVAALDRLDELLGVLDQAGRVTHPRIPPRLAAAGAQAAVRRVTRAVVAVPADPALPRTGDGRQLAPLGFVDLQAADVHAIGRSARVFGRALLPGGHPTVADALATIAAGPRSADGISVPGRSPSAVEDLVAEAARLHGLLDLPWDDHVARLATALPPGAGAVTLTGRLEHDYDVVTSRLVVIWHHGDHLAPARYRGGR